MKQKDVFLHFSANYSLKHTIQSYEHTMRLQLANCSKNCLIPLFLRRRIPAYGYNHMGNCVEYDFTPEGIFPERKEIVWHDCFAQSYRRYRLSLRATIVKSILMVRFPFFSFAFMVSSHVNFSLEKEKNTKKRNCIVYFCRSLDNEDSAIGFINKEEKYCYLRLQFNSFSHFIHRHVCL